MKSCGTICAAVALFAAGTAALAADSTRTATIPAAQAAHAEEKIAAEFALFAGSPDNARSLVTGLGHGSEVTLSSTDAAVGAGTSFTPPTRPMGHTNVRIALALAQEQLIRLGITRPTPDQIKTALVGGTVPGGASPARSNLPGVLQLRAEGMGWGGIANSMGTKLGHVMSGFKQTNQAIAAGQPVPGVSAAGAATSRGNGRVRADPSSRVGIVTAAEGRTSVTGLTNEKENAKP